MSATGEVTILDATERKKYVLAREAARASTPPEAQATASVSTAAPAPEVTRFPQGNPPAMSPNAPASGAEPRGVQVGNAGNMTPPAASSGSAAKRRVTVAYSPEESAEARRQLLAAAPPQPAASTPAATIQILPAQPQPPQAAAPQVAQLEAAVPPGRLSEEAPKAKALSRSTVAYAENPFSGDKLIPVSARDQDPDASSPLTYRERSYFTPRTLEPAQLESLLRAELSGLQQALAGRPRGQFVNLAVFDHYFSGRPQRPPVATLQWKDWRGAAEFALAGAQRLPSWHPSAAGPVRSSFAPAAPVSMAPAQPAAAPLVEMPAPANQPAAVRPAAQAAPAALPLDPFAPIPAVHAPAAGLHSAQIAPFVPTQSSAGPASATAGGPFPPAPVQAFAPVEHRDPTGEQDRRLAEAFETTQDLYFLSSPLEGLEFAVKLLSELVPSEAVSGCIYDINTDEFRFVALQGPGSEERRAEAVPSSAGLLGAAVRSRRESFVANAVDDDPRYDAAADGRIGLTGRSLAYFPLQKNDHLLGMLQLINRENERGFSDADVAVASYVASQVAEFLQSRRRAGGRRR